MFYAENSVRALDELLLRAQNSRLTPERAYDLILDATNDQKEATNTKMQLLLASMPNIDIKHEQH